MLPLCKSTILELHTVITTWMLGNVQLKSVRPQMEPRSNTPYFELRLFANVSLWPDCKLFPQQGLFLKGPFLNASLKGGPIHLSPLIAHLLPCAIFILCNWATQPSAQLQT